MSQRAVCVLVIAVTPCYHIDMKVYTFRLKPSQDLKTGIENFVKNKAIKAGFIVTCVAGLDKAVMRMAGAMPNKQDIRTFEGPLELTSLVGTVSTNGSHLHISVSDREGRSFGGHLKEGTIIHPTAEIVIGEDSESEYVREHDSETGFDELVVRTRNDG